MRDADRQVEAVVLAEAGQLAPAPDRRPGLHEGRRPGGRAQGHDGVEGALHAVALDPAEARVQAEALAQQQAAAGLGPAHREVEGAARRVGARAPLQVAAVLARLAVDVGAAAAPADAERRAGRGRRAQRVGGRGEQALLVAEARPREDERRRHHRGRRREDGARARAPRYRSLPSHARRLPPAVLSTIAGPARPGVAGRGDRRERRSGEGVRPAPPTMLDRPPSPWQAPPGAGAEGGSPDLRLREGGGRRGRAVRPSFHRWTGTE